MMIKTLLIKDLKIYFSDKRGIIFTFLLPILLISLFTVAFGGIRKKNPEPLSLSLLIADEDQSSASARLIGAYKQVPILEISLVSVDEGTELITNGKSAGMLRIGQGFEAEIATKNLPLEFNFDAAESIQVSILQSVLNEVVSDMVKMRQLELQIPVLLKHNAPGLDQNVAQELIKQIGNEVVYLKPQVKMNSIIKPKESEANLGLIQAVAGTSIMMLLFSIAAVGAGLLNEKESGTINRLLATPATINDILLAKMGTGFLIGIVQLIVLLLFAWLVFGLPIFINIFGLILLILAIAFAVTSFGILLSALAKTRQQLEGMSTIVILFMSAIGGSMVPIFAMPAMMKQFAMFSVNYWGIQGFFDIFWRGLPTISILPKIGVLVGIGLIISLLSIKILNKSIIKSV